MPQTTDCHFTESVVYFPGLLCCGRFWANKEEFLERTLGS